MNIQSNRTRPTTARQQQAELQREHLLEVALSRFAAEGYAATSIKKIAEQAGVAVGLLYHYFPSKDAVLAAVMERHGFLPELRALLLVDHDQAAPHVLCNVAAGLSALIGRKEEFFRLVIAESQSNPQIAATFQGLVGEGIASLGAYLESRVVMGELRPHDTRLFAQSFLGSVLTAHLLRLPPPSPDDVATLMLHGVLARTDTGD